MFEVTLQKIPLRNLVLPLPYCATVMATIIAERVRSRKVPHMNGFKASTRPSGPSPSEQELQAPGLCGMGWRNNGEKERTMPRWVVPEPEAFSEPRMTS